MSGACVVCGNVVLTEKLPSVHQQRCASFIGGMCVVFLMVKRGATKEQLFGMLLTECCEQHRDSVRSLFARVERRMP
jgi:hypothetical protein